MKLRTKYILFVALLHSIALVLAYIALHEYPLWFIVSEVLVVLSMVIAWHLYRQLITPLKLLMQGAETIQDKDFTVRLLPTASHEMNKLIAIYNQMIDELRKERTLQEQQHLFLHKLINTSPTGIIVLNYDERVQQVNPRAQQLLDSLPAQFLEKVIQLPSGQRSSFSVNGVVTYKLQKSHFIDRGFARHFVMIEELTEEILAAEKKAYGKVIRMMAHEVNNSIGPVNSILQSALSAGSLWQDGGHRPLQHALQVAIDRNYNLNSFMRNYADLVRLPIPVMARINLQQQMHAIALLMEARGQERLVTIQVLANEPFYIEGDERLLEQVWINVVKNAMEAIGDNGLITLQLCPQQRLLEIIDTGKGISADTAAQLFTPFFSTKRDGQGIGLTLVKEVLLAHGFTFSLQQVQEGRTVFTVNF
ncbi:PAS domain-containing protein [Filimonas lacunae]|uniref:histidine kinase n=1 Tax=Filimonas lacunae TaxID=477680 RepID=A0A173MNA4_9BACT|nr:ATP-binding protein [Filimonas lacunae]BAV08930.1 sensor histidine kinase [Filimonas lacunae]SIS64184.1 PAS domain-containing protein [Filimonas lacunae]